MCSLNPTANSAGLLSASTHADREQTSLHGSGRRGIKPMRKDKVVSKVMLLITDLALT